MSGGEEENHGTGLNDVFDIVVKAAPERLLSLTVQLCASPEDTVVHALCLVVLRRNEQALNKFQMLGDNRLAKHLAEKLQIGGGDLEDFGDHCGRFELVTGEMFKMLARIFRVLSEQRLCDPLLRDLAYRRALSAYSQKTSTCENPEFAPFLEEAKAVCGPEVAKWMFPLVLKSDPHRSLDDRNTTLNVSPGQDRPEQAPSLPSPLQASSLSPSYPSHLEISLPSTGSYQGDKQIPEISDKSKPNTPIVHEDDCEAKNASGHSEPFKEPQTKSSETAPSEAKKILLPSAQSPTQGMKSDSHLKPNQNTTPNKLNPGIKLSLPTPATNPQPNVPVPHETRESADAEEEDGQIFYAFVILHAPEDADMAEGLKERMEKAVGSRGAIFSEEFAVPGRSTLKCVEDAINNSGFTVLLLTQNFNTRMEELETNSALINSINKEHKYNTVIPLLPQENRMPRENIPLVLSTLVLLLENDRFESKIKKAMNPANLKKLKDTWSRERRIKHQVKKQEELKKLNQLQRELNKEYEKRNILERENLRLRNLRIDEPGCDGQARLQQLPNIEIHNAQYIIIGNDSQMTVDYGGAPENGDVMDKEKEK